MGLVKQVGNSAGSINSRTAASVKAFEAELRAAEKAAEAQRLEPVRKIEAEMNKVYQETERLRIETVLTNRESAPECLRLNEYADKVTAAHTNYTQRDWQLETTRGLMEFDVWFPLLKPTEPPVTDEEKQLLIKYCCANGLYMGDYQSFLCAFSALKFHGVIRKPEPVAIPQADGDSSEPEPEVPLTATEQRKKDTKEYVSSLHREISNNPIWIEAINSIVQTSGGKEMSLEAQYNFFKYAASQPRFQPFSFSTLRAAAISFWGAEEVGLLPSERADREETKIFESQPADEALKTLGIPTFDGRSTPPVRRIGQ